MPGFFLWSNKCQNQCIKKQIRKKPQLNGGRIKRADQVSRSKKVLSEHKWNGIHIILAVSLLLIATSTGIGFSILGFMIGQCQRDARIDCEYHETMSESRYQDIIRVINDGRISPPNNYPPAWGHGYEPKRNGKSVNQSRN